MKGLVRMRYSQALRFVPSLNWWNEPWALAKVSNGYSVALCVRERDRRVSNINGAGLRTWARRHPAHGGGQAPSRAETPDWPPTTRACTSRLGN
jgi:hypothetical protein